MEANDSRNKLHSRLRLWEFPDQYIIEPADGSGAPCLEISRVDASMKLIDQVPECNSLRVPKICSIFGVVGMLKLLAGSYLVVVTESERVGSFLGKVWETFGTISLISGGNRPSSQVKRIGRRTNREFEDDHNGHNSPHCINTETVVERLVIIEGSD